MQPYLGSWPKGSTAAPVSIEPDIFTYMYKHKLPSYNKIF